MNARRKRQDVQALIDQLDPYARKYDRRFDQLIEDIYSGDVIIEEACPGDPPVLTDKHGRLLRGTGQREGVLLPESLYWLSVGVPRDEVDFHEYMQRTLRSGTDRELFGFIKSVFR